MASQSAARSPTIVLTHGWGLGTPSGVARHVQELARHLGRAGARVLSVNVSTSGYTRFPRPALPDELQGHAIEGELAREGVEVVRVDPHPLHWLFDGRPVRRAVERILAREQVDAVLGFFNEAALLPDLCQARGIVFGYIATWLSYRAALSPHRQGPLLRRLVMRRANQRFIIAPYRRAGVVFANSEFTRGELVDVVGVAPERIVVTYLGVQPELLDIPRTKPERIERLFFFGRLVPEKGAADLVQALGKLAARGVRGWSLRIAGSGSRDHVARLARELGIAERVEFLPHLNDEDLRAELQAAQLAVLPSYSESFGLAIAEAQAAGLAVVAYAAGSVPEVVEDGKTAWLAPLRDVGALAACIERALNDAEATWRAGLAGRERVRERFTWPNTAARVVEGLRIARPCQP
jgi:glycosyltransferase involved in cell wall biosynthesis